MIYFQVFLSASTAAVYFVYLSNLLKKRQHISSALTLLLSHVIGALTLLPYMLYAPDQLETLVSAEAFSTLLYTSVLLLVARYLYFYAYSRTEVANITVFSALTPIYGLGTGYLFFKESPNIYTLLGLLLICGSIYALFLKKQSAKMTVACLLQPFYFIARSRPVLCAFLSTIPPAFAAAYQKELLLHLQPAAFSFALFTFIGLLSIPCTIAIVGWQNITKQIRTIPWHFYAVSASLLPIAHIAFCYVIGHNQVALSLVLQRTGILMQILLAYYFLHERQDISKRIVVGIMIIIGFALVAGELKNG